MPYLIVGAIAILAFAALRLRRPTGPNAPPQRWNIVVRHGPMADFSCGHRCRRYAAFSSGEGPAGLFIRKIPRWLAREVPCPDCVLVRLLEEPLQDAAGFERLVPIKDALAAMAERQKNRPD